MKASLKQRIEEFARLVKAIQDLSLARLRSRREDGLSDYEAVISGVIKALKRVNHDDIWRETAARLAALRAKGGDPRPITESLVRNAIQCRSVLHNDVHDCLVQTLRAEMDSAFKDAVMNNRQAVLATRLSCWPCTRAVIVAPDSRSAGLDSRRLYLLAVNDVFAATGVTMEMKLDRIYLTLIFVGATLVKSTLDLLIVWFPCRFGTRESLERLCYSPCLIDSWENLNCVRLGEESLNAFVIWPTMTATFIAVFLVAFIHSGVLIALWAAASGAFLSTVGGLVCSSVLSIRACGAGGVALGIAFGVGNGLVAFDEGGIASLVAVVGPGGAFAQIVGGLVAVGAHRSLGSSPACALLSLVLPALGMASAARLMAQPLALKEQNRPTIWREATGSFLGSLVGFGAFILVEAAQLLGRVTDARTAFLIADGAVSLAALSCLFHFRAVSATRAAIFVLVYSVSGMALTIFAIRTPLCWLSLLASAGATALFHAQLFTLAWLIAYRIGGWRAAVIAATIEGAGGYVGYALSRAF